MNKVYLIDEDLEYLKLQLRIHVCLDRGSV